MVCLVFGKGAPTCFEVYWFNWVSGNLVLNMLFWVWGVYVDWLSEVSFYYPKACARVSPHIPRDR